MGPLKGGIDANNIAKQGVQLAGSSVSWPDWIVAFGTLAIAIFTWRLWLTTKGTLEHLEREFVANHRPRLRIRNVVVRPQAAVNTLPILFAPQALVSGQLYVVNVGDTAATIVESGCWVEWSKRPLPMERSYEGKLGNGLFGALRLEPGQSAPGVFQSEKSMGEEGVSLWLGDSGWMLWVMGWISYTDDRKTPRRTSFCRAYMKGPSEHPDDGHFAAVENPDYEHEE